MTITTELLDQSLQLLNSINIPVGQLETIGIPVYRAFNNLVTFRQLLVDSNKQSKEAPAEQEAEIESEAEPDVGLTD